ncbi:hypothetical protein [Mucilaginibacter sp.]|uniref:toxin-antitoxin system YwqK family antitoxin n=1 Tax=Mucilaginibacter sp. TaxID=1882438 RepID=UPI00262524D9|nr:hypothetical protein [Mucilaginibacter sp.]MDB5031561.1 hypothetical protein [Mucilaginibacter sp.]
MKNILILMAVGILYCPFAIAQTLNAANLLHTTRRISFNFVGKDSVNMALNDEFDLIEDSCKQVIRYAKLDMRKRKYLGKIKDVSSLNPNLILTEGNYTADGLKDGYFITHYLNGQLQAKGSFKNNEYEGKWEMYYDDGKPKLTFEANGKDIKITDAWDAKGVKTIDNGKGTYRVNTGSIYWKGKLLNGKPDGAWSAMKTDDATNTDIATEKYKNGAFQKGTGPLGDYNDVSRMALVPGDVLPFVKAELLHVSMVPCNGVKRKHIVNAQYAQGFGYFSEAIKRAVEPYLKTVNIKSYENQFNITGEVNDRGFIVNMTANDAFNQSIAQGLIASLRRLPALNPATVDGKPVTQKFNITFNFGQGLYSFSYRFLQIEDK